MAGYTREKSKIYKTDHHGDKKLAVDINPFAKFKGSSPFSRTDTLIKMSWPDRHRRMVRSIFGPPKQAGLSDIFTGGIFQFWWHGTMSLPDDARNVPARRIIGLITAPIAGAALAGKAIITGILYIPGLIASAIGHGVAKVRERHYLRDVENLTVTPCHETNENDQVAAKQLNGQINNIYARRRAYHTDRLHDFYVEINAYNKVKSASMEDNHLILTLESNIIDKSNNTFTTETGQVKINLDTDESKRAFKALTKLNMFKVDNAMEKDNWSPESVVEAIKKS